MIKKIGIITIYDNNNYGNRLQNYGLQETIKKCNYDIITFQNKMYKTSFVRSLKEVIKKYILKLKYDETTLQRLNYFLKFTNDFINSSSEEIYTGNDLSSLNSQYDHFIIGSDQIWNYHFRGEYFGNFEFAMFADKEKSFSYSASIGIDNISDDKKDIYIRGLNHLKYISVREDRAKEIVEELTGRNDVEVLIDPTMLLTADEWDKVSKRPKQLDFDKYILNYFLGELSESRKKEIERVAKENNCQIINILDHNDPFYVCGPSEFLYLEKHAFLICTDSFHSSVFAILYDRPFVVFEREDNTVKMNSRIETLINKFKLKDKKYEGRISEKNLNHDYSEAYKILEFERKKSFDFLKKALDVEE